MIDGLDKFKENAGHLARPTLFKFDIESYGLDFFVNKVNLVNGIVESFMVYENNKAETVKKLEDIRNRLDTKPLMYTLTQYTQDGKSYLIRSANITKLTYYEELDWDKANSVINMFVMIEVA